MFCCFSRVQLMKRDFPSLPRQMPWCRNHGDRRSSGGYGSPARVNMATLDMMSSGRDRDTIFITFHHLSETHTDRKKKV